MDGQASSQASLAAAGRKRLKLIVMLSDSTASRHAQKELIWALALPLDFRSFEG